LNEATRVYKKNLKKLLHAILAPRKNKDTCKTTNQSETKNEKSESQATRNSGI
jgi:hypothetical protein